MEKIDLFRCSPYRKGGGGSTAGQRRDGVTGWVCWHWQWGIFTQITRVLGYQQAVPVRSTPKVGFPWHEDILRLEK